jgi:hypothetical protein
MLYFEKIDQFLQNLTVPYFLPPNGRGEYGCQAEAVLAMHMARQQHIRQNGYAGKKLYVLKRPADPVFYQIVRGKLGYILAVKHDLAAHGPVISGDTVQKAGFAGSVGPYYGKQIARSYGQIDIAQCHNPSETQRKVYDIQIGTLLLLPFLAENIGSTSK